MPTPTPPTALRAAFDTVVFTLAIVLALWALALVAGCSGTSTTVITPELDVTDDTQSLTAPVEQPVAYAASPLALFPDVEVQPDVPHGYEVTNVHGLYGRIPFDEDHTIFFDGEFPDDFMLAAIDAIEDANKFSKGFTIRLHDGGRQRPDVLVRHTREPDAPPSPACNGENPEGQCWTGHADCMNSVALGGGFYACRQWQVTMSLPNMRAWAYLADRPIEETFAVLFEHEVFHTLGLGHGYGIMSPKIFVAESRENRPILDPCHSAILQQYEPTVEPGLRVLETPGWCL
jgi:hypothetical protein